MKIVWTIVALLLIAGLVVILQPPAPTRRENAAELAAAADAAELAIETAEREKQAAASSGDAGSQSETSAAKDTSAVAAKVPSEGTTTTMTTTTSSTTTTATTPTAIANAGSGSNAAEGAGSAVAAEPTTKASTSAPADAAAVTQPGESKAAATEPKPATPEEIAAGAEFTPEVPRIEQAEILPSRFVKLPDGAISVDDAWTIRGAGTAESPYEVSWEFLSSAQETYVPRLSEKKIPARIAFLHGKVVRISGYLAFPLVAPTSSECLAMLNQWDGCCIGIPPTPYDAIEVKLATELKGWKKHTINFGAITGEFKVEPYLVENWLVGLYLMEKAKINTEL
ncbi:MAG: hypothetical protein LW806_04580 [Planctomycetaceae bacterium]|nr:hypothetical protein [Planctomycetaceae bacterium]